MATALPSARRGQRRRRSSTPPGCSSWTRNHPPPESVFPRARHGRSLPRSSELAFRDTYAASGPNREPGRILIPGDGAAGDQGAQNRPACPAMAATRCLRLSRLNDLLARYGRRRTCRLVTGRSHRPRSTWPNQARLAPLAVTHRYNWTHCLWLEQFQIADSLLVSQ